MTSQAKVLALEQRLRVAALDHVLRRPAPPGRARHPGLPHRRLQQPLAPRLDPRRRRRPRRCPLPRPLAGQRDAGRTPASSTPTAACTRTRSPTRASPGPRAVPRGARTTSSTGSTGCSPPGRPPPCRAGSSARRGNPQVDLATPGQVPHRPPRRGLHLRGRRLPRHRRWCRRRIGAWSSATAAGCACGSTAPAARRGGRRRRPLGADGQLLVARSTGGRTSGAVLAADLAAVRRPLRRGAARHHHRADPGPLARSGSTSAAPAPRMTTDARHLSARASRSGSRGPGAPGQHLDWIGLYRCARTCDDPGELPRLPLHPHPDRGVSDAQRHRGPR